MGGGIGENVLLPGPGGRRAFVHGGQTVYEWSQSLEEVLVAIRPPRGVTGKMLDVRIAAGRARVGLRGAAAPFLDEALGGVCEAAASVWTFDAADGELLLTLAKAHRAVTWESAFRGHGAIGDAGREDVHRQMLLERFGAENPGFDFSQAQINGRVPDPRVFSELGGREGEIASERARAEASEDERTCRAPAP